MRGAWIPILLLAGMSHADWTSPGDGSALDPEALAALSGGAFSGVTPSFLLEASITISAGDTLRLPAGSGILCTDTTGEVELRVHGVLLADGTPWQPVVLAAQNGQPGAWAGLVLDESPASELRFIEIAHADRGLSVLGCAPRVSFADLHHNFGSGLHCFLGGDPIVAHTAIRDNVRYGVEATGSSSPVLHRCLIQGNNSEAASPRNAVSVGIQGSNSPRLAYCLLEGLGPSNPASGFSLWMSGDPLLESCEIRAFRSGVVIQGSGALGRLENCWIHDNRYQDPLLGGSGVNINSSAAPVFRGNWIANNDWGVTVTSACDPDLGQPEDPGNNAFGGNGNNGTHMELFNNTSQAIQARGNWWNEADSTAIEERINDDSDGAYGTVHFTPFRLDSLIGLQLALQQSWIRLDVGDSLWLQPARRFRSGSALDIQTQGPGLFSEIGDSLLWLPEANTPSPALLRFLAEGEAGAAVDSLWVFHPSAAPEDLQLTLGVEAHDLLLEWTAQPEALFYRVYGSTEPWFVPGEATLLEETGNLIWRDEGALSAGRRWYRVEAVEGDE